MNKRILIIFTFIICILLSIVTPMVVNAAEDIPNDTHQVPTVASGEEESLNENKEQQEQQKAPKEEQAETQEASKEVETETQEASKEVETETQEVPKEETNSTPAENEVHNESTQETEKPSLEVVDKNVELNVGDQHTIEYNIKNVETQPVVSFTSDDDGIAKVSNNGVIKGIGAGETKIHLSCTIDGVEYTDEIIVKVSALPQEEPVVEPPGETPTEGETTQPIAIQKAKVIISKVDENENPLAGAKLQIIDSNGKVLDEWISNGEDHEILLPDGKYKVHEVEAPDGYDIAEDEEFTVKVIVEVGYQANTEYPNVPCQVATTYTVKVKGIVHEVYCINQFLEEPGQDADYNGKILTAEDVRKYTQQVVYKDPYSNPGAPEATSNHGHVTDTPIDVSDRSLEDEELYNVLMDIVYRRTKAREQARFSNPDALPDEAISYLTEAALKTYTNAGVTQVQAWSNILADPNNVDPIHTENKESGYYWYLMNMYRDYVYDPDSPGGWRVDFGKGDALGNFARHWNQVTEYLKDTDGNYVKDENGNRIVLHGPKHKLSEDHPEYAAFFYYLLGDETSVNMIHPDKMHIYIYSAVNKTSDGEEYQNLLGITGYLEDFEPQVVNIKVKNKYSTEKVDVTIQKVWNDNDNQDGKRPASLNVTLSNGDEVTLNEENSWKATVNDLPKYDKGKEIVYTWKEGILPEGYKLTIINNKGYITTLTNSYTPEVTEVTVKKVWKDADNQDGIRPESIIVTLSNGMKVTLNKDNNWEATIKDLPVYEKGEKITYTWTEADIKDYELINTEVDGYVTTLTNQHTPEVRELSVLKVWADDDDQDKKRPKDITISLLANGKEYDTIVLSEDNEWTYIFKDLPVYNDGEKIEYTVREDVVPEDYEVAYEETETGFIIHNVKGKGGDEPPPDDNPQTGNNIVLYLLSLLISIIGLTSGKVYLEKIKEN